MRNHMVECIDGSQAVIAMSTYGVKIDLMLRKKGHEIAKQPIVNAMNAGDVAAEDRH